MSPLQQHSWSPRKAQARLRTMCQLQSHVWHMRQSRSVTGPMSLKQVWEPPHERKWCCQSCIVATIWYIQYDCSIRLLLGWNTWICLQQYHMSRKKTYNRDFGSILLGLRASKPNTSILDPLCRWLHRLTPGTLVTPGRRIGEYFAITTLLLVYLSFHRSLMRRTGSTNREVHQRSSVLYRPRYPRRSQQWNHRTMDSKSHCVHASILVLC